jgi:acetyl-CoA C-acetyltransferase
MRKAVIVGATRTAVGTFGGAFAATSATDLGAIVVRDAIKRAGIESSQVDEVILGNVLPGGLGLNPARVSALAAGVPKEVGSYTINKACGSGLKAVALAAGAVCCGESDVVVAGGMENMSQAPYLLKKARFGYRMGNDQLLDSMIADGLNCPITLVHMGVTAENISAKYGVSRREQDEFARQGNRFVSGR